MTAKKTASPKGAPPPVRPSKKQLLMNREAILKELETSGSFRGGSPGRRDLFMKLSSKEPIKAYVLPDIKPRGRQGELLPRIQITAHWMTGTREDGQEYPVAPACLNALFVEEPYVVERLVALKAGPFAQVKKYEIGWSAEKTGLSCAPCAVIEKFGEEALPRDSWGENARLAPQTAFLVQAVSEEGELRILPLKPTAYRSFISAVLDVDIMPAGQFESLGVMAKFEPVKDAQGKVKSYIAKLLPNIPCPLSDWKEKLLDLELMGPNFMPWDEQVSLLYQNLPGSFTAELANLFQGVEPPTVARKVAPPSRPARVRGAR